MRHCINWVLKFKSVRHVLEMSFEVNKKSKHPTYNLKTNGFLSKTPIYQTYNSAFNGNLIVNSRPFFF